jgi:hypothetical protein
MTRCLPRRRTVTTISCIALLCTVWSFPAAADVLISNMPGNDGTGTLLNGDSSTVDNSKAAGLIMPAGLDYSLDDVVLRLEIQDAANNPVIQIWSNSGGTPGTSLMTLTNPTFTIGVIANYSFTPPSQFTLAAGQTYWIVIYNDSPGADSFEWYANSPAITPTGIATSAGYLYSTGPPPPTASSSYYNSYEVNGTTVPVELQSFSVD